MSADTEASWIDDAIEKRLFFHATKKNECAHEWGGYRAFEDGNGGEQVCKKCGLGAMAHTLSLDF